MDNIDYNLLHANEYASLFSVISRLGLGDEAKTEAFRRAAFNHLASNCDDHSKNFSFVMDIGGVWRLAPAYDVTFAYNSKNTWLKEHLMGISGKFSGVSYEDLSRFADAHGIPYARHALKKIKSVLGHWPDYAKQAGVSPDTASRLKEYLYLE